jgi:hypothetical protein
METGGLVGQVWREATRPGAASNGDWGREGPGLGPVKGIGPENALPFEGRPSFGHAWGEVVTSPHVTKSCEFVNSHPAYP